MKGVAALAAVAMVAAACGSSSKSSPATTGPASSSTAAGTAGTGTAATTAPSGNTTTSTAGSSTGGGTADALVIARGMDINSLDPALSYCDTCQIFMTAVYETLIGLDPKDNKTLIPRLATKWDGDATQTNFTFTLDPKAKFPDGAAVTSTDVKFSWQRLAALKGSSSYLVGSIDTIDDSNPGVVKVKLKAANSAFLAQVDASYLGIVEKKVAEANGATMDPSTDKAEPWFLAHSAGSGPFALDSYASGSELRLKRNDSYWGTKAAFPEVIMKETPQAVTQRQQLEQGSVDIAMQISADVASGMGGPDISVTKVPSFNYVYLAISPGATGGEKLTPDVREAIRDALDYKGLLDVTVGGAGQEQASPIPNGFAGSAGLALPVQDVAKAKSLLSKAGITSLTLDATYPSLNVYGVDFSTAMQKVQTDLKAVGITLTLNPVEISVWADKIGKTGIPVTMLYFAPDHTDSSQYVQYFGMLKDSQWQGWSKAPVNPAEQDLLTKAFATQDATARASLYNQLGTDMINDQIIIPVVNPDLFLASRSNIKGLTYSACCNLDLAQLSRS